MLNYVFNPKDSRFSVVKTLKLACNNVSVFYVSPGRFGGVNDPPDVFT